MNLPCTITIKNLPCHFKITNGQTQSESKFQGKGAIEQLECRITIELWYHQVKLTVHVYGGHNDFLATCMR